MTTLNRVVIDWSGAGVVGRAVTVLHFSASDNASPPCGALVSAFEAAKGSFPAGLKITVPNAGDVIDDTDGSLVGTWTSSGGNNVLCTAPGGPMAGVGAVISWKTGGIVNGTKGPRRLRGRTFLVPISSSNCDGNGVIAAGALVPFQTLANAIMAAGPLAIWHRPSSATATDGNSYGVISGTVRNKVAYLSSRRD